MSLRSMAVLRAEAEAPARAPRRAAAARRSLDAEGATPADPEQETATQLTESRDQLIALIPSEAVALFILLIGLTAKESLGWRLVMLLLVVAFAIAWTAVSYFEAKGGRVGAAWPFFEMAVGVVAFLAWSTSVPAAPFADLDLPTWVGPAIVAVVSFGLVLLARARAVWAKRASAPAVVPG